MYLLSALSLLEMVCTDQVYPVPLLELIDGTDERKLSEDRMERRFNENFRMRIKDHTER